MSHTKEPWKVGEKKPFMIFSEGSIYALAVASATESTATQAVKDAARIVACVNACANLPEPEKNIRELVAAATGAQLCICSALCIQGKPHINACKYLTHTIAPFEEKKNERPLD